MSEIKEEFYGISNKIKAVDRRLDALNTHSTQYENYKQLAPKEHGAFYDRHSDAKHYFEAVMNGKTALPVKA